jgi:serine/threonine protein kinase
MFEKGKLVNDYFSKERLIFMEINESLNNTGENTGNPNVFHNLTKSNQSKQKNKKMHILIPKRTHLRKRLKTNDEAFFDFIKSLLEIDPNVRLSAAEALNHPWIVEHKYPEMK